tara:strand:- start:13910 stop:14761 length:852 start_codon:yes stop_codon:yes gene_type:complete
MSGTDQKGASMARSVEILRLVIDVACAICLTLALVTPVWFLVAAFGTKWEFWDWHTGLQSMTLAWGMRLLLAGLVACVFAAIAIGVHGFVGRAFYGNWLSVLAVGLIAVSGTALAWNINRLRAADPVILDVTTDFVDPPHFSVAFVGRRSALDLGLDYAAKLTGEGEPYPDVQTRLYPEIAPLHLAAAPEDAYRYALETAREGGWRIATASQSAGMFEAGAEGFWYGFRDDMVVRIRPDEAGGSLVDVRSLARQPVPDGGRNAQRVADYLAELAAGQAGSQSR